jgi:hypothetical protein
VEYVGVTEELALTEVPYWDVVAEAELEAWYPDT